MRLHLEVFYILIIVFIYCLIFTIILRHATEDLKSPYKLQKLSRIFNFHSSVTTVTIS